MNSLKIHESIVNLECIKQHDADHEHYSVAIIV